MGWIWGIFFTKKRFGFGSGFPVMGRVGFGPKILLREGLLGCLCGASPPPPLLSRGLPAAAPGTPTGGMAATCVTADHPGWSARTAAPRRDSGAESQPPRRAPVRRRRISGLAGGGETWVGRCHGPPIASAKTTATAAEAWADTRPCHARQQQRRRRPGTGRRQSGSTRAAAKQPASRR